MEFLPKNKWFALIVFILIVAAGVILATSILKIKPDAKHAGLLRFSLGGGSKAAAPAKV